MRNAPVDALKQHRQLCRRQTNLAVPGGRPDKSTAFKALGEQARSLAVPPDNLQQITAPSPEHKQMAAERIGSKRLFRLGRQRIKTAPHIRHTGSEPDPRIARYRDQETNPFNKRDSASPSKLPSTVSR